MNEPSSINDLVERHRQGDPDAAGELFAHYAQRLGRLAGQHLSRKLAGRVDGEDVVQSVFRTFFRRSVRGDFKIDSSAQLWQLLVKITVTKARAKGRYHTAAKRDVSTEQGNVDEEWLIAAADREPGPEDAVLLMDEIEALLRGLPPLYCQILELRLQGHSVAEVADQLGVARQTVYRALELLKQRLEKNI